MPSDTESTIERCLARCLGEKDAAAALGVLDIDTVLMRETGSEVSRAAFAMALNVLLFRDLLERVPTGAAYVAQKVGLGQRVRFDHGALRTIRFADGPTGALPAGQESFARILEPLGYAIAGVYPLPALKMTGRAWRHLDAPEAIPQFFVSELHVEQFDDDFRDAAERVFSTSRDPLDPRTQRILESYARGEPVDFDTACEALPVIAGAFDRQHEPPSLDDYEHLLAQSAEAAWIATEGNAFNHATDRVADVVALADALRTAAWPIKDKVEISASGRVRQTALRADVVDRGFAGGTHRAVPGSFYEFISRDVDPATGKLDLRFDSANATGIFGMTRSS